MRIARCSSLRNNWRVGNHALKQRSEFGRHLLRLLGGEEAAGRQRAVEHAEHFDPLRRLEVEQHVLAQDQRISLKRLLERQQVVTLKVNSTTDRCRSPERIPVCHPVRSI